MVDPRPPDPGETYVRNCTILEEVENHEPTDEEVRMYARAIGIDPDKEADLLYIAREGISAPVPKDWIVLQVLLTFCRKHFRIFWVLPNLPHF